MLSLEGLQHSHAHGGGPGVNRTNGKQSEWQKLNSNAAANDEEAGALTEPPSHNEVNSHTDEVNSIEPGREQLGIQTPKKSNVLFCKDN